MPTSFTLRGTAQLTNLPDQEADFLVLAQVADDTVGREEQLCIRGAAHLSLVVNIDTSEASYSVHTRLFDAMNTFLTKHGAGGSIFTLEDGDFWAFGPTAQACWLAQFEHRSKIALAAQDEFMSWMKANPPPAGDAP